MSLLQRPHLKWQLGGTTSFYTCSGGALGDRVIWNLSSSDVLCIQGLIFDIINGCNGGGIWWQLTPRGVSVM